MRIVHVEQCINLAIWRFGVSTCKRSTSLFRFAKDSLPIITLGNLKQEICWSNVQDCVHEYPLTFIHPYGSTCNLGILYMQEAMHKSTGNSQMISVWVDRTNSCKNMLKFFIFVELLFLKIFHIKKCEVTFGFKYIEAKRKSPTTSFASYSFCTCVSVCFHLSENKHY